MCSGSTVSATDNDITGNTAPKGGGVHVRDHSVVTLKDNDITGNHAISCGGHHGYGGGVHVAGATCTLEGNLIADNLADNSAMPGHTGRYSGGGGVYSYLSTVRLIGNTIVGNSGGYSGTVRICYEEAVALRGNLIEGNSWGGISIGLHEGSVDVVGNVVKGNSGYCAGIYCTSRTSDVTIANNLVVGNVGTRVGGIWLGWGGEPGKVVNNTIAHNVGPGIAPKTNNVALADGEEIASVDESDPSGTPVTLNGSGSSDPDGDALSYAWDFESDGIVDSTDKVVTATYAVGGPFVATLTVTDPSGESATDTVTITVVPGSAMNQLENVLALIEDSVDTGDVASQIANSLIANIDGALAAIVADTPGSAEAATGKLQALINQVEAQSGKKIDPATAQDIIARAQQLIDELNLDPQGVAARGGGIIVSASAVSTAAGAEIVFTMSAEASVSATVLNIAGRTMRRLVADRTASAGINSLSWNACSDSGLRVPSGTYLVRISTNADSGATSSTMAVLGLDR